MDVSGVSQEEYLRGRPRFIEASDGNLWGVAQAETGAGQIFQITKSGGYEAIYDMTNVGGLLPCWLIQGSDGIMFGIAFQSGLRGPSQERGGGVGSALKHGRRQSSLIEVGRLPPPACSRAAGGNQYNSNCGGPLQALASACSRDAGGNTRLRRFDCKVFSVFFFNVFMGFSSVAVVVTVRFKFFVF